MTKQGIKITLVLYFTFMALLFITALSEAAIKDATLTLTPPTKRADGTALTASEIKHYLITIKGPSGTSTLTMTGSTQKWTPPAAGQYTLTAATVDTGGRTSVQSAAVTYTAIMVIGNPDPPALIISMVLLPAKEVNGVITVGALDYIKLSPGHTGDLWTQKTVAGVDGLASPDGAKLSAYEKNARVDYLVDAIGGTYALIINNYATDGNSDSVWVGKNGLPAPEVNGGKPVFSVNTSRGKWADTAPVALTLPAGQSVITLFKREAGYVVSWLKLVKNK